MIISNDIYNKFLIAKSFLDNEATKITKENSLKILMRQYNLNLDEAVIIYNFWRRLWCDTSKEKLYFTFRRNL